MEIQPKAHEKDCGDNSTWRGDLYSRVCDNQECFSVGGKALAATLRLTYMQSRGSFLSQEPNNGASIADEWGTRETFVAVITTNLPMIFHLFRTWLARGFGSAFQSSQRTYQIPSGGFQNTGGGTTRKRGRGGTSSRDPITVGLTFTESEERMMHDIKLQTLEPHEGPAAGAIMVSNQIEVTHQTRNSHAREPPAPGEDGNW